MQETGKENDPTNVGEQDHQVEAPKSGDSGAGGLRRIEDGPAVPGLVDYIDLTPRNGGGYNPVSDHVDGITDITID